MPACRSCYNQFPFTDLTIDGFCETCARERARLSENLPKQPAPTRRPRPKTREDLRAQIVMTTETVLDRAIAKRFGIVSAEAVVGMNIFKDLALEIRDIVGGRAKLQQDEMRKIKVELFDIMRRDADKLGANMIVGVSLSFSDFGARGGAILATALGTAVLYQPEDDA